MRICDLHSGRNRLTRAARDLRAQWLETVEHWRDDNSHQFEERHLEPLAPQITLMVAAIQRMHDVLNQAERDCWDEDERTID